MEVKTKFNIGDKIFVVELSGYGVSYIYDGIIGQINIKIFKECGARIFYGIDIGLNTPEEENCLVPKEEAVEENCFSTKEQAQAECDRRNKENV